MVIKFSAWSLIAPPRNREIRWWKHIKIFLFATRLETLMLGQKIYYTKNCLKRKTDGRFFFVRKNLYVPIFICRKKTIYYLLLCSHIGTEHINSTATAVRSAGVFYINIQLSELQQLFEDTWPMKESCQQTCCTCWSCITLPWKSSVSKSS